MILTKLNRRLRALLRKPQLERELDDELSFHLDQLIERNLQNGMIIFRSVASSVPPESLGDLSEPFFTSRLIGSLLG